MRILLIDNYDSFTYNLVHYIEPLVSELIVCRNDELNIENVASFDKIIISPGPALPAQAGKLMEVIKMYHRKIPMLGVCLGFQAILEFFGGELINMTPVRHGISKKIELISNSIFNNIPNQITIGLYHSWGVESLKLPNCFNCLAKDSEGVAMAISHNEFPLYGVQFHPESIMTEYGHEILENWVNLK